MMARKSAPKQSGPRLAFSWRVLKRLLPLGAVVAALLVGALVTGLAGLGGAYLSTVALNVFLENMTGDAGWIAVAIVIFGNWSPGGIVLAALKFGGAEALQLRLQTSAIAVPREFIVMFPSILTLLALAEFVRRPPSPAQLCIPFRRNKTDECPNRRAG